MAEARSATSELHVTEIEEKEESFKYARKAWKRSLTRRTLRAW